MLWKTVTATDCCFHSQLPAVKRPKQMSLAPKRKMKCPRRNQPARGSGAPPKAAVASARLWRSPRTRSRWEGNLSTANCTAIKRRRKCDFSSITFSLFLHHLFLVLCPILPSLGYSFEKKKIFCWLLLLGRFVAWVVGLPQTCETQFIFLLLVRVCALS